MRALIIVVAIVISLTATAAPQGGSNDRVAVPRSPFRFAVEPVSDEIVQLYRVLADLSLEEQRQQMWGLPSETKGTLWRYNLEQYHRQHPELSFEAQQVLLEGIRLVITPGWFDLQLGTPAFVAKMDALDAHRRRIEATFDRSTIHELFARLGPEPVGIDPAENGRATDGHPIPRILAEQCTCGSWYDCAPHKRCETYYGCQSVYHCGVYGTDLCWGHCKLIWP